MLSDRLSLSVYLFLLIYILILPFATHNVSAAWWHASPSWSRVSRLSASFAGLLVAGLALTLVRKGFSWAAPLTLSLAFLIPFARRGRLHLLGGLTVLMFFPAAVWWMPRPALTGAHLVIFVGLGTAVAFLPELQSKHLGAFAGFGKTRFLEPAVLVALGLIGIAAGALTGVVDSPVPFLALWHHWDAYLSPVQALVAGGVPFRDFPIQYGLGPTLLLATVCDGNCIPSMYYIVVLANALYLVALGACVLALTANAGIGIRSLALLAAICAVVIWAGYPPNLLGSTVFPSVAGLRFLPLTLLLAQIFFATRTGRNFDRAGHAIWFLAILWSPEAAFFGSLVWWPYLALRQLDKSAETRQIWLALVLGGVRGLVSLAIAVAGIAVVFRLTFGAWPSLSGYLIYINNPPGMLPVNLKGPLWLMLASLAIATVALVLAKVDDRPTIYACLLALIGVGTYYLSRSHDNNILNLFPFLVLLLVATASIAQNSFVLGFARAGLVAIVGYTATTGLAFWEDAAQAGKLTDIGLSAFAVPFDLTTANVREVLDPQAIDALTDLREEGPVVLFNSKAVMPPARGAGWTGVNNYANFAPLPRNVIEQFVVAGALRYARPGWMVTDQSHRTWLDIFGVAYDIVEERRFGDYTAAHLVPRHLTDKASSTNGVRGTAPENAATSR